MGRGVAAGGKKPVLHHAVTHTIAIAITTCCSYSRPRVHMHGSNYMAQGQMQPCIAQRTPTRRPDCLPGSAGGQGILSCSATKTPTALARPACRPMGGGGRNIPRMETERYPPARPRKSGAMSTRLDQGRAGVDSGRRPRTREGILQVQPPQEGRVAGGRIIAQNSIE